MTNTKKITNSPVLVDANQSAELKNKTNTGPVDELFEVWLSAKQFQNKVDSSLANRKVVPEKTNRFRAGTSR